MLTKLFDGRTAASSPAVSPDGQRIAFVVATIDLTENTTRTRVWLAGPEGDPAPITAGPERRAAGVVARRTLPRVHVEAGREGEGGDAARDADHRAGRGAHRGDAAGGIHRTEVVARRQAHRVHQPHPRSPLRGQGRELAGTAQDRDVLHPAQRRGVHLRPASSTSMWCPPTAPAHRATSRRAPISTRACHGCPTRPPW